MQTSKIKSIISQGEGLGIEFKECRSDINKSIYNTVCAFLNRSGGEILLGVKDNGEITGIDKNYIEQIKKDFITAINNPQKITPPVYLSIEEVEIERKSILYIYVPESSQVHKCNGKIFDRNQDGDLNITDNNSLVTGLYMNKQTIYTENRVYPYCEISDLRSDIIKRVRKLAAFQRDNHPWENMTDIEILKSGKLYTKDYQTNKEGFTLAAILLFGKDETILSVIPHHKTDLILRRENLDRYDDRDDVRTNLIESYDRIIAFAQKHLPDPFYLEGVQRISVRDKIFREIASNILIHREYFNAFPAKIIIEKNRIYAENSNKPHGHGIIDPENFSPYPKNPVIARIFKEIGLADELGSGVRNLVKYVQIYSNSLPQLIEEDIFKIIIPLTQQVTEQATEQATEQDDRTKIILEFCKNEKSTSEIMKFLGLTHREHFRTDVLNPLINKGLLFLSIPDKPSSPKQKYYSKKDGDKA
ncbi:MAG: putative DNA binding domain-containing protein [Spirochaetes bacterium]|nr:putative DNA binding domain-containing protein [Spirochaetota bacterium]